MVMALTSLSHDVLLYIGHFCELEDLFSLAATCVVFRSLSQQKTYWLTPLIAAREHDPIACPLHDNLRTRSVEKLKHIARQTLRLRENWSSPESRIYGEVKRMHIGDLMDFILQVPGTPYYILHCRSTGDVVAFDASQGPQGKFCFRRHLSYQFADVSPGFNEPGRFSMGLLATEHYLTYQMAIVLIEYDDDGITNMSFSYQQQLPLGFFYWAVFMSSEYIGVLRREHAGPTGQNDPLFILVYNRTQGKKVVIETNIDVQGLLFDGHSGTWVMDDDIYFLTEHTSTEMTVLYRFPKSQLPTNNNLANCKSTIIISQDKCMQGEWTAPSAPYEQTEGALTADPYYRVPCVSLHSLDEDGAQKMQIRFWSRLDADEEQDGSRLGNTFPAFSPSIATMAGSLPHDTGPWQLSLIPHSGRYLLMVVQHADAEAGVVQQRFKMTLVSYNRETKTTGVHGLEVPDDLELSTASGLSLDDHMGSVSLITNDGYMVVINYA